MASKSSNTVTTVYQCSECDHCSQNLEDATLHAVQEHGEDERDDDDVQEESEEESFPRIKIKQDKDELSSDEEYSSEYKQVNGSYEQQRDLDTKEFWSADSTKALIECAHEHYTELRSKTIKKRSVWEQIKSSFNNQIPGLTAAKCEQRWRSLLAEQKKYLSSVSKSYGKSKSKKPEFYDEVAEVVGEDSSDFHPRIDGDSETLSTTFRSKGKKDSLTYSLQCLLQDEDVPGSLGSQSNDALVVLGRLVSILEQREAANQKFHSEVLEMEREKLKYVQRFVESRERFNAKRLQLMKEWMMNQPKAKRKRGGE